MTGRCLHCVSSFKWTATRIKTHFRAVDGALLVSYSLTNLLTYSLHTAESFLISQPFLQLVKKFPAFYGTRSFITAITSARHLSLSWASSIQSIPPHPTSWRSILILPSHLRLGLRNGLFPSAFPTKTLYTPPLSTHTYYMPRPSHFPRFDDPSLSESYDDETDDYKNTPCRFRSTQNQIISAGNLL